MLPVWLSDLRGALLLLLLTAAARAARFPVPAPLLLSLSAVCAAGLSCSVAFYIHTTRTVFNRRPKLSVRTFWSHLMLTRPLEVLWRFLTAPLRVRPDFLILGEVRTGTTSMAAFMREIGCIGPFSPWIVPLASDKESFYFVGHYWGMVHPGAYSMCFPLKLTMWMYEAWYKVRPPVFDACASHLNAPWAAPLIHEAAPEAALLVLLRPPAEQNVSWWRLEMGAHGWARSMGMSNDFLMRGYPPASFEDAVAMSRSKEVQELYREGELAASKVLADGRRGILAALRAPRLPERLLPFPGGQLCAFDSMGHYAKNVARYLRYYRKSRLICGQTAELATPSGLIAVVERLGALVPALKRLQEARPHPVAQAPRLNESPPIPSDLEPRPEVLEELARHYQQANLELKELLGPSLSWT
eukprot:TRINITY_DN99419_c0_g1_i1.p1 TRINITY_DN99419_c0_g1~~TRINITY_DN99419_c0_g1_i1.p1  ORF type:complete len:414 (+),score=75.84 TRINITY_DN99419_c0_g1_i1:84-1325(+)